MNLSRVKTLCIITSLLATMPVYAEQSSSTSVSVNKHAPAKNKEVTVQSNVPQNQQQPESPVVEQKRIYQADPAYASFYGKPVSGISFEIKNPHVSLEGVEDTLVIKKGQPLKGEALTEDAERLFMTGYFQSVVPKLAEKNGNVDVTFALKENPIFKKLNVTGGKLLKKEAIPSLLGLKEGTVINTKAVGTGLQKLDDEYKKAGYALFAVKNFGVSEDGVIDLEINEGLIEGFRVRGIKKTKEYVVLREMRQKVGDPLNTNLMKRSGQRLYNLGLFEDVNMKLNPGKNPDNVEVVVDVIEANTATVGFGVGYSQSDGFVGQVSFTDKNLFGKGDSLFTQWEFGGETEKNYQVSFSRPYIDKKGTSMSISFYDMTRETAEYNRKAQEIARYDKRSIGQDITFSRADSEFTRNYLTLKHRHDMYVEPEKGYSRQYFEDSYNQQYYNDYGVITTKSDRIKQNFGSTRAIVFSRVYDNRDNVFDPHRGKRNELTFEWAGFGGDFNYRKLSYDQRYYWAHGKNTLALDAMIGYAWGDMPLSQRFALGGASLRGYEDDQFRGNSMLKASLEYRIPIAKKISTLAFVDAGYAWDKRDEDAFDLSKIKVGYGIGFRIQTPIGPVKLDYGFGKSEGSSHKGRFHFSFGGNF
jgi:outer membrane protein insertion porin family